MAVTAEQLSRWEDLVDELRRDLITIDDDGEVDSDLREYVHDLDALANEIHEQYVDAVRAGVRVA